MKHVLILAISDHADTPYDAWAAEAGVVPHLLVAAERASGYAGMAHAEAFNNYRESGLIEKRALEIAREIPIEAIIARGEVDILRAARLRAALGLPGQLPDSALAYRDKIVMKEHFHQARVPVADYAAVDSAVDVLQFVARYGYPIVVKPALGSGSLNTHIVHNAQELNDVLVTGFRERYVVERFVPGDMYHVDGLIVDGEIAAIHPSKYFHDCLCFQRGEFLGSYPLASGHPLHDRLTSFAREMIAA